jgi:hypothetical protein
MELSFKSDPLIKQQLIKRMDHHIAADNLLQKATGANGKGCTVWCALNNGELHKGYDHSAFPDILGLPEWLARLQDTIFEGLGVDDAKAFSSAWPKAIPVGKNLEPVKWRFCAFVMKENIERVLLLDIDDSLKKQVVDSINGVLSLHERAATTGIWDRSAAGSAAESARSAAWSAARSAAESARSAARSAAGSAAGSAAESAAESARAAAGSAAESARSAARSAAGSAAESARSAAYRRYADELLRLLAEA